MFESEGSNVWVFEWLCIPIDDDTPSSVWIYTYTHKMLYIKKEVMILVFKYLRASSIHITLEHLNLLDAQGFESLNVRIFERSIL